MSSKFTLSYPVKPNLVNQYFGQNPAYYAQFKDVFGKPYHGHDGIDFYATHGEPVYAAHDGMIHFEKDSRGGEGMILRSQSFGFDNFPNFPVTMYWHLVGDTDPTYPSPIPLDGAEYAVFAGDLIGYADNTGFPYESTGDHHHFGLYAIDAMHRPLNQDNGFNGRIDPMPFFVDQYAQDIPRDVSGVAKLVSNLIALARAKFPTIKL